MVMEEEEEAARFADSIVHGEENVSYYVSGEGGCMLFRYMKEVE